MVDFKLNLKEWVEVIPVICFKEFVPQPPTSHTCCVTVLQKLGSEGNTKHNPISINLTNLSLTNACSCAASFTLQLS